MFESLSFLWLRRTELFILNQEFSLTFTRSDVNTCALLQNGYIAFRKLDKFLETVWILSDLEAGLSQLFLYISSLSKKRDLDPTGICVLQKNPKTKIPKQTKNQNRPQVWQDLAQSEDIECYCLFYQEAIQPLWYSSYCMAQDHQRAQLTGSYAGLWSVS